MNSFGQRLGSKDSVVLPGTARIKPFSARKQHLRRRAVQQQATGYQVLEDACQEYRRAPPSEVGLRTDLLS